MAPCVICEYRMRHRPPEERRPREAEYGQACGPDYIDLHRWLSEIPGYAALLPAALEPSRSVGQRVSGSREPAAPARLAVMDLMTPVVRIKGRYPVHDVTDTMVPKVLTERTKIVVGTAAGPRVTTVWRRQLARDPDGEPQLVPAGDQIGHVSIAQSLDAWVTDWSLHPPHDEHPNRPLPTVRRLIHWLKSRLEWACERHPDLDVFTADIQVLRAVLLAALNQSERPLRLLAPCPYCHVRALLRDPGGGETVQCAYCHTKWKEEEYELMVRVITYEMSQS